MVGNVTASEGALKTLAQIHIHVEKLKYNVITVDFGEEIMSIAGML
jgi:hypothetical protein